MEITLTDEVLKEATGYQCRGHDGDCGKCAVVLYTASFYLLGERHAFTEGSCGHLTHLGEVAKKVMHRAEEEKARAESLFWNCTKSLPWIVFNKKLLHSCKTCNLSAPTTKRAL